MSPSDKPLRWLHGEVKTPPFTSNARVESGYYLRKLQRGENLGMSHSRPMPIIGPRCHELRIVDANHTWRIIYRKDADCVLILEVFAKKTQATPQGVIDICKKRIGEYDAAKE